jgi:hypothetical protein
VARVQSAGAMPGRAFGVFGGRYLRSALRSMPGGRRAADRARRRRWRHRFLGVCLVAAAVGWPVMRAGAATAGPPAPTGLSAAAVGSSQISLSWTAPVTSGLQPSQYNIYKGTSSGSESLVGSSSATSFPVSGLASGTTYYFEVSAVYEDCIDYPCLYSESARSPEASASTGFSVPGAPTGLTATAAGSSQVRLSWTAPTAAAGAPVTDYKIYAGTSSGGESLANNSSVTSDTVSRLSSGTTYYFEVTALNSAGESTRSNETSATTDRTVQGLKSQVIGFGPLARQVVGARFTVSASASSGLPVSFRSDTPDVCSVSGSVVTTVKPGTCTIVATQAGNTTYASAPDQLQSFQVDQVLGRQRPQAITFLRPADVAAGRQDRLSASASSGLPVSFRSDTPDVCSVSGSVLTTVKPGTCTITASQAGNTIYAPAPDQTRSFQVGPGGGGSGGAQQGGQHPQPTSSALMPTISAGIGVLVIVGSAIALRRLRVRSRPPSVPQPSVRVVRDTGTPAGVHVRPTGTQPTVAVRIEPHPGACTTWIKEIRR